MPKETEDKIMRNLEDDYRRYEEIESRWKGNEEQARDDYQELLEEVRSEGKAYGNLMRLYCEMKRRGNERIDFDSPFSLMTEAEWLHTLRTYGIKEFTLSSGWSSAVESAWKLQEAGAKLEGLIEINGDRIGWKQEEVERKPAYLFRVG